MPPYAGTGKAQKINYNQQMFLWQNEAVAAGQQSLAVQLTRIEGRSYPWGAAVELSFSGPPGVFEVDVQASETDTAGSYVTVAKIQAVNASNVGRADLTPSILYAKFLSLNMVSLTNAVNTTALVTR